ncbi:DUF4364 family protein [Clostridium rectalis]|uniref:DUF4364 family protein n=1 Tax=Clostridium rectalis TaxID=2040295 RepID=UPI000F638772|nr:DUF4364 family protein [Clostridium rectalis]
MFEDTSDLAENKLLLLYIFNKIKVPVSNNQITQMILENNFINYFTLQQYLSELIASNFLTYTEESKHRLELTPKGEKVLSLFMNRVSKNKLDAINEYLNKQMDTIKKELTITSDYTIEHKDKFIVNLRAVDDKTVLIDLKLTVSSNKEARDLCSKWKNKYSQIYASIIDLLTTEN